MATASKASAGTPRPDRRLNLRNIPPQALSKVIGLIYEGPLETVPWAASLRWLIHHLDASWVVLVLRPASRERPSLIIQAHYENVTVSTADYTLFDRYSTDPFTDLPRDRIMTPEQFIGAEAWSSSAFFNDYLVPNDIHFQIGADFLADEQSECRFRACRPLVSGAFSDAEKNFCELLIPHFKRAVHLHSRLYTTEVEQEFYASTFDRMQVGTVILDESGKLVSANQAATAIFAKRESVWPGLAQPVPLPG